MLTKIIKQSTVSSYLCAPSRILYQGPFSQPGKFGLLRNSSGKLSVTAVGTSFTSIISATTGLVSDMPSMKSFFFLSTSTLDSSLTRRD